MDYKSVSPGKILREKIKNNEEQLKRDYEIDRHGTWVARGAIIVRRGGVYRDLIVLPELEKTAEELQTDSFDDYILYIDYLVETFPDDEAFEEIIETFKSEREELASLAKHMKIHLPSEMDEEITSKSELLLRAIDLIDELKDKKKK